MLKWGVGVGKGVEVVEVAWIERAFGIDGLCGLAGSRAPRGNVGSWLLGVGEICVCRRSVAEYIRNRSGERGFPSRSL